MLRTCQCLRAPTDVASQWRSTLAWANAATVSPSPLPTRTIFGTFAADYDRHRPSYPEAVFDTMVATATATRIVAGSTDAHRTVSPSCMTAVDVGCGSGRAALALFARKMSVVASDSDPAMLRQCEHAAHTAMRLHPQHPPMTFRHASSEALALESASADLLTVFQAFHWMDLAPSLQEFARVLRPGGILGLAWNDRDLSVPWVSDLESVIEAANPRFNRMVKQSNGWGATVIANTTHFDLLAAHAPSMFPHTVPYASADDLLDLLHTYSYVKHAVVTSSAQAELATAVRALVRRHHGTQPFQLPYVTKLFLFQRNTRTSPPSTSSVASPTIRTHL
jgi:SAM-dependent methyltransferase